MANIKGSSAAIYSPVGKQKLDNNNFEGYNKWNGESFYIEDKELYIKNNGFVSQRIKGANKNEIWLFSGHGKGQLKLSIYFIDYNDNAIYCSSEQFNNNRNIYMSTYGVAPERSNSVLVKIEGEGQVNQVSLQHLKPLLMLNNWEGSLQKTDKYGFEQDQLAKFKGKAEEVQELDSINFNTFQEREKIFIGFTSSKSLFNRVEGTISTISNLQNNNKVKFECTKVKVPLR